MVQSNCSNHVNQKIISYFYIIDKLKSYIKLLKLIFNSAYIMSTSNLSNINQPTKAESIMLLQNVRLPKSRFLDIFSDISKITGCVEPASKVKISNLDTLKH